MKTAVTGGTGFIGAMLVDRLLERGDTVALLCRSPESHDLADHPNLTVYKGDLTDPQTDLASFIQDSEVLFHCAGEIREEGKMRALHVEGVARLVEASRGTLPIWVQLSSVGAYGPHCSGVVTEDTPAAPVGVYEVTKTLSDSIVLSAAAEGAFQARILRPANVIGRTMRNQSLAQFIGAIDRGHFAFIGRHGATTNYVAVDNLVEALLHCAKAEAGSAEIYNLADTCSLENFVEAVCSGLGRGVPRLRIPLMIAQLAAFIFQRASSFPLTVSRVNALSTRVSYHSDKIFQKLEYRPLISIEACAADLAANWKRDHGST